MTKPTDETCHVAIIGGSERTDVPIIIASGMLEFLTECGLRWLLAAISAHRHPYVLKEFCEAHSPDLYICAVGMNPGLSGFVAAYTNSTACPVISVALPNAEVDPDGSKCLTAMCMQPPGVPVLVAGVGKTGLVNAAYAAAFILGLTDPEIQIKVKTCIPFHRPLPNLNVQVLDTAA